MGRAGDNALTRQPEAFSGGQQEEVVGRVEVSTGGEDSQAMAVRALRCAGLQGSAGTGQIVAGCDLDARQDGKLGQVRSDPVNLGKQAVSQRRNCRGVEQFPARGGAQDGIEDDGDPTL